MKAMFQLLRILHEETDSQHRMSQQQMLQRMQSRFGITLNRRTLKNYLEQMKEAGLPLNAVSSQHRKPDGRLFTRETDWYLEPLLEQSELRLLLDLLYSMPALPEQQREELAGKLRQIASPAAENLTEDSQTAVVHLHHPPAKQLLYSVELLCEAIRMKCKVAFQYCGYELAPGGKPVPVPRCEGSGLPRLYRVSPYRILVSQGRYYLVCCKEPYCGISHYRIDRMLEMHLLPEEPVTPPPEPFRDPTQTLEQLYMYSGERITCRFLADVRILGDITDWFGDSACIVPAEVPDQLSVTVTVHPKAMEHWALQYTRWVTVQEPESLRRTLSELTAQLAEKYPPKREGEE